MEVQGERDKSPLTLEQFAELLGLFVGVLVFIGLLGMDIVNARKKRAHWVPGNALILSALTIQVMNLLNAQSTLLKEILNNPQPLSGEVTTSAELMASEEQVKPLEEAVKVTEIESIIEGPTEEEAPACSLTQEVRVAQKTVDESPGIVEKSAEEITVMPHASDPEAESAPVESDEVSKLNDSTKVPEQGEPAKEETVGQPPAEALGVEGKAEGAPNEDNADVEGKSEE